MADVLTVKCAYCKEVIELDLDKVQEIVKYDNGYYHKECFRKMCEAKLLSKNTKHDKWLSALSKIDEYNQKARVLLEPRLLEDKVYRFILDNYNYIGSVPAYVFTKLKSIYKGTYRGLAKPIPPSDLLDMWKRQMKYLKKNRTFLIQKGTMDKDNPTHQVNYDLAVLVGKYDSYLRWKEKQKLNEVDKKNNEKFAKSFVETNNITTQKTVVTATQDDNMDDILSDIFGEGLD